MHKRLQIRNALVGRLKTAVSDTYPTIAKDRVFGNRLKPLFDQFLPAILVYCKNENILEEKHKSDGHGPTKRELEIAIEAILTANNEEAVDELIDEIANQIENSLDDFEMDFDKSIIIKPKSTENESAIEGSKIYGAVRLNYTVTYYV